MGDRWILDLKCAYCNNLNEDIWYAPTSSADTFKCEKCGKYNFITYDLKSKKMENVKYEEVEFGFLNATNVSWDDKEIEKMCRERFNLLKKGGKKNEERVFNRR